MKVLHLLASPFFSGPAESLVLLARAQRSLGHDVSIAFDRKRTNAAAEELLAPHVSDLGTEVPLELSVKSSVLQVYRDVKTLGRATGIDVLHCHFSHDHLVARWARRGPGPVLVRSIHAPRSLRWSTPLADGWTVPTDDFVRARLGRPTLVLPALVDPRFTPPVDRARLRRELGLPELKLIGMVSTFQPSRRHLLGVEAFAVAWPREAHLVLVGDGGLLSTVKDVVARRGLSASVTFAGYQRGDDYVRWLSALDEVWVLGLGNDYAARVAAQARACGVRVVAVDEGALPRYADVIVTADVKSLVEATRSTERRTVRLDTAELVARNVVELYLRSAA